MSRSSCRHFAAVEPLEARIAPASIFVSGKASGPSALKVLTEANTDAQDSPEEIAAQESAGSTAAVLLVAGDKLIFDADGNHVRSAPDYVLMEVSAGSAMVFLTNNSAGKNARAFERTEISGLAVSDGFIGVVRTDINGSVVTGLDSNGDFTGGGGVLTLPASSIAGLRIEGQIAGGHLLTGMDLEHVTIGGRHFNTKTAQLSVTGIVATGTAANDAEVSFNGGGVKFAALYQASNGTAGGDIRDLTLAFGTTALRAGDGASGNGAQDGGAGGSIVNTRVLSNVNMAVSSGDGGSALGIGKGGAGGSIQHGDFDIRTRATDAVSFSTGHGGNTPTIVGGTGGSFLDVAVRLPKTAATLSLKAGNGGDSGGSENGAAGGGFVLLDLDVALLRGPADLDRVLEIRGGAGGAGGLLGGDGGAGGDLVRVDYSTRKTLLGSLRSVFVGGDGGESRGSGGTGGAGGDVRQTTATFDGSVTEVRFLGGRGGNASGSAGDSGGAGGAVNDLHALVRNGVGTDIAGFGGLGGDSLSGAGGAGGDVMHVTLLNLAARTGSFSMTGGDGGAATDSIGGDGGELFNITIHNLGALTSGLSLTGGGGGRYENTGVGASSTGNGGGVRDVLINNHGRIGGESTIVSGATALTAAPTGDGSVGLVGAVEELVVNDYTGAFTDLRPLRISTGSPGFEVQGAGSGGGTGGTIDQVHLKGPKSTFILSGGNGADAAGSNAVAGSAGDILNVTGRVGKLIVTAGDGGNSPAGTAGEGGSVSAISLGFVGKFVQLLAAGDGGHGTIAGGGGSVHDISIPGAIGDFTKAFSLFAAHIDDPGGDAVTGMGGLVAGRAGIGAGGAQNGTIADVSATKIAAILAGRPSADRIGYENAVTSMVNVRTLVLGADVNRNGAFNFVEGGGTPGYQPDNALTPTDFDRAIDGLVLVKAGGAAGLPVTPLKLIEV